MKNVSISLLALVALVLLLAPGACTPGSAESEADKITNTLQSVSYVKDTLGIDLEVWKSSFVKPYSSRW